MSPVFYTQILFSSDKDFAVILNLQTNILHHFNLIKDAACNGYPLFTFLVIFVIH